MATPVNLLDCEREPSDEQLEQLMRTVAAEARAKAAVANRALKDTLAREMALVRERHGLSGPRTVAAITP